MTVGRSWRTPAKHDLMRSIVGAEIGATRMMPQIKRLVWFDLTAGDGITADGLPWERNCSPGILAHHATNSTKPVDLLLYEIKPATFDRLLVSLKEALPGLGYVDEGDCWRYGDTVVLRALNASGAGADVDIIGKTKTDAVLVSNDPNAITDWAMRPTFAEEITERTPWFRSISTMGCNPAGLKRLSALERLPWFGHVAQQEQALPRHRDLLLAAIDRDDAQWAYLLGEPVKWRAKVEAITRTCFRRYDRAVNMAWCRDDSDRYEQIKRTLFLTKAERAGA